MDKILKITKIEDTRNTAKGEVTNITAQALDTKESMKIGVFHNGGTFELKVGEEVVIDGIREGKPYNGKKQYNASLMDISNTIDQKEPENATQGKYEANTGNFEAVPQSVWDRKDLYMRRMNSWGHVERLFAQLINTLPYEEAFEICRDIAHKIEEDITR